MQNNRKHIGCLLSLAAVVLLTSGCSIRDSFTVASTKLVRLDQFELDKANKTKNVQGEDTAHIIIFVPTGSPNLKTAMDRALEKGNGDVMTDVVIESSFFYIPYIYGQTSWKVNGDVIKTRRN